MKRGTTRSYHYHKGPVSIGRLGGIDEGLASQPSGDEGWSMALSDIMTLMLIFFLVLGAVRIEGLASKAISGEDPGTMRQEEAPIEDETVVFFDEASLFDGASGRVGSNGLRALSRLAEALSNRRHYRVSIKGIVDEIPVTSQEESRSMSGAMDLAQGDPAFSQAIGMAARVASAIHGLGVPLDRISLEAAGLTSPWNGPIGQGSGVAITIYSP